MSLCIEIQISSSSNGQQDQLLGKIRDAITGLGFRVDQQSYTPSSETQSELGDVETGHCTIKTYEG